MGMTEGNWKNKKEIQIFKHDFVALFFSMLMTCFFVNEFAIRTLKMRAASEHHLMMQNFFQTISNPGNCFLQVMQMHLLNTQKRFW